MKRFFAAIIALGALALSGCASVAQLVPGSILNVAETSSLVSLNPDVVTTLSGEHLADELANLTSEGFYSLDENGLLVANTGFGTATVDSRSPFTVTYEVAKTRKWSDGQPVDSADLALSFAAATDPEGVRFHSRRLGNGLQFASVKSIGLRSITLQFSQPISDWRTALTVSTPAHIVASAALDGITASAGKAAVISALQSKDVTKLGKLSESYRSVYSLSTGSVESNAFVSNGAYSVVALSPNEIVTLKATKKYVGLFPPIAETVNVRLYKDSLAAISDMNDGKVDIIAASESGLARIPDLIGMVGSLSTMKAEYTLRTSSSADMVLLNFGDDSVFGSAKYRNHPGRAAALRKAFMSLVPRARIVQDASATTEVSSSDSFVYPRISDYYNATVAGNGSENYLMQDVEQAYEIVQASGADTPIDVRVVFDATNPRSVEQFKALSTRAASAGFNVFADTSDTMSRLLNSGKFDVFIGPRPLLGVAGNDPANLTTSSLTRYTDAPINALLARYAKASKEIDQARILEQIDARLFATGYGLPLYQVPNLMIYRSTVSGLKIAPFGDSATWGYWTWSVSTK